MRIGIEILPQQRWRAGAALWQRAEAMGFDHAWTFDHLAWRTLVDEPWFATVPTLTAAAMVTSTIRLGTWVASPNYRHPVTFAKELMSLDDISAGRILLGVGSGGTGVDADVLGRPRLDGPARQQRFTEFVELLDQLLRHERTTWSGEYFSAVDARMIPGSTQQPRMPFVVAANGPRSMALAAAHGEGWATVGTHGLAEDEWWTGVARLAARFSEIEAEHGRSGMPRYLDLDTAAYTLDSVDHVEDSVGRARELGFTDVLVHWPRQSGIYAGDESVLEALAERLPALQ
ncbi:LLM class flavin-dependent oxidoreductase [Georgenia sunbinii]|uniref:LLM class flavin-dependent oxidoreductase n=1 Tax=Georgenia sunbinii TaxID=3117728 RepID=UPI002F26428D